MPRRLEPDKPTDPTYRQIWRVVDGVVKSALDAHPDFLASQAKIRTVRNSIVKRVAGAIHGYAEQSAWVRSGSSPADASAGIVEDDSREALLTLGASASPVAARQREGDRTRPPASPDTAA